jgi:hypothetical protein
LETGRYGLNYNFCSGISGSGTQLWNIVGGGGSNPPTGQGKPIKWALNGQQKCLTVSSGALANGAALTV